MPSIPLTPLFTEQMALTEASVCPIFLFPHNPTAPSLAMHTLKGCALPEPAFRAIS